MLVDLVTLLFQMVKLLVIMLLSPMKKLVVMIFLFLMVELCFHFESPDRLPPLHTLLAFAFPLVCDSPNALFALQDRRATSGTVLNNRSCFFDCFLNPCLFNY